eukprot:11428354-Alexandrium_andersonii.AAC.1
MQEALALGAASPKAPSASPKVQAASGLDDGSAGKRQSNSEVAAPALKQQRLSFGGRPPPPPPAPP